MEDIENATYEQKTYYSRLLRKKSPLGILTCPFCKEPITDDELERSKQYPNIIELEESCPIGNYDDDDYLEYTEEINRLEWHPYNITVCHGDCADFLPDTDRGRLMLKKYLSTIYGEPARKFEDFCDGFGGLGSFGFPQYKKYYETIMRDKALEYLAEMKFFE